MKITYARLRHPQFNSALTKLLHAPMPLKDSKRLLELTHQIRNAQILADELAEVLKNKVADEHPVNDTHEVQEYLETEVYFDFEPLSSEQLTSLEVSASDLLLLEGILE